MIKDSLMTDSDRTELNRAYYTRAETRLYNRSKQRNGTRKFLLDEMLPTTENPLYGSGEPENFNKDSFHRAIGPILVLGQIFGLMPVFGILGKDASHLKFKWVAWRMVYCMIFIFAGGILAILCLVRISQSHVNIHNIGSVVFYFSSFLTYILFFRLAIRWPMLGAAIQGQESRRALKGRDKAIFKKFSLYSFLVLFFALVEHILSLVSGFTQTYACDKENPIIKGYYKGAYPQVFDYTSYTHWKAALLQITNIAATFNWNYMDLFIVLICLMLTDGFGIINDYLEVTKGKDLPEQFWRITRNEYAHMASLVRKVDDAINELVMLSFANNLYIICLQLFNSFDSTHDKLTCWKTFYGGMFSSVYFVFSFSFLISRFLVVSLSASNVHSTSKGPLPALYSVSTQSYCVEVQRFLEQVSMDMVSITGLNFFNITKGLILTIAGTVVTYELVLVQFNQPSPSLNVTCNNISNITNGKNIFNRY